MTIETRANSQIELRVDDSQGVPTIYGYAATYDTRSDPIGGMFYERIERGTFRKALERAPDVRALIDHKSEFVLGRMSSGTLRLKDDDKGLLVEINPPDTSYGRDIVTSIRRGDINNMSFGFRTIDDRWEDEGLGLPLRTLLDVELEDVSVVTFPAYPNTEVAVRSCERFKEEIDLETRDWIRILKLLS